MGFAIRVCTVLTTVRRVYMSVLQLVGRCFPYLDNLTTEVEIITGQGMVEIHGDKFIIKFDYNPVQTVPGLVQHRYMIAYL